MDDQAHRLQRLRGFARVLDSAITLPGGYRIGLDGLFGLLPGVGDTLGGLASSYIIVEAARLGASTTTLLRMVLNVLLDVLVGLIPLAGDLFDFVWKANERNLALLERQLAQTPADSPPENRLGGALIIVLLLLLGVVILLGYLGLVLIIGLINFLQAGING